MTTTTLDDFTHEPRVAYFSMEIALRNEIPTYAGGLGVLAGDTLRSAADLGVPVVAVTLASTAGYFRQSLDASGHQTEEAEPWEISQWAVPIDAMVAVTIEGRRVWIGGWLYIVKGHMGGAQPVILLDTDLEQNGDEDRAISRQLYGGDDAYRLKQEVVLGIGGIRMLQALGFQIRQYHMNEGHSALLALELLRRYAYPAEDVRPGESPYDVPRVRELCCFTTHTPVEAGHDKFGYDLVRRVLGDYFDLPALQQLAGTEHLNMTHLALNLSEYVNGVARRHAEVSRHMFPGYRVHAVTNGVHPFTWTSAPFRRLYDEHLPGWCHEPELLIRAECCIDDEAIRAAHVEAKRRLIEVVRERSGVSLDADHFTIGFARRMTAYKRPDLLFSDLQRLKAIAQHHPIQIVLSGKAHPNDGQGKRLIETLYSHLHEFSDAITVAYLPGYDMATALALVSGVDVWLNTPLRPMEASGTSGMKAAFNGVPHLSVLDGWWVEGCIEGITGWAIGDDSPTANGDDAGHLYQKLEQTILPLYYQDPAGWTAVMKGAIAKCASFFNSQRMMRRYASEAYIR